MEYHKPNTVAEAVEVLRSSTGMIVAGGTDLAVYMAEGVCQPDALIDIGGIESMQGIRINAADDGETAILVGACTSIAQVASSEVLPACLRQGAHAIGSPQIRNLGTIGGNICNASPCGDTLAPLLCLDARFVLRSEKGTRTVASAEFFTGPKRTILEPGELLECIELPAVSCERASAFRMIGKRNGQAISQVNAAVSVAATDGILSEVRVAVGSVAPVPLRLAKLETTLTGLCFKDVGLASIREPILEGIRPIDDVRSSATYRQNVTVTLVFDALIDCARQYADEGEGAGAC